jgi:DNA-dependent protein kinase catalytic subunit
MCVFYEKFKQEKWPESIQGFHCLLAENPDVAGELHRKAESETPKYLLKARLCKLAPSPEAYLQLRANCARTWATANVSGYIAGVGDRHTGNLLLDSSDGSIVPIDFGYSFGVPFLLPIPELTPFRLSPQLLQCFEPLNGKACVTQMMTQTMRVLRQVIY